MALTFVELTDLPGTPRVRIDLPQLHAGSRLVLQFHLERQHLGRHEVLDAAGEFHVVSAVTEVRRGRRWQIVQVTSTGKVPSWQAVKKPKPRRLAPARSPRTIVL